MKLCIDLIIGPSPDCIAREKPVSPAPAISRPFLRFATWLLWNIGLRALNLFYLMHERLFVGQPAAGLKFTGRLRNFYRMPNPTSGVRYEE